METTTQTTANGFRRLHTLYAAGPEHWVGDGFRVRTVFHPSLNAGLLSPFVLLDHAARMHFEPSTVQRGVGEHPHRGFETVTFAFAGEVEHRDSSGGGGRIGPGDVQWMTAASGVVHEEMHSRAFTEAGGDFEMVQLWVNLPAAEKMGKPGYQSLLDGQFPRTKLGAATGRLIAGHLHGETGPAKTHTPMTIVDLNFDEDGDAHMELPSEWTTLVCSLEGELTAGDPLRPIPPEQVGAFARGGSGITRLRGSRGSHALVLAGQPLNEPVVAHGPFVMNNHDEIVTAMRDYQSGKMGSLP
ncbi:MAG: hypothetical protein A2289_07615 [Deltaproteobacteria bacterium RIFOXYA12_FULL_58_15]|nr:MAG: hypothetical protein A2289_07615 [Deltaproteobacteria bacterium RIFOXYA12_FULL_58_15]OGR10099.1 MAG: hypothetical protein A2341_21395 [Deltaproteobacteria bacterium RIFOXYB12_FULL_58_9]